MDELDAITQARLAAIERSICYLLAHLRQSEAITEKDANFITRVLDKAQNFHTQNGH